MTRLMVISGLALAAACQSAPPAPVAFDAARQPCEFCRMVGSNGRFAAELVSAGEDPLFFDDIGCLRGFLARGDKVPAEAVAYVVDHRTGAWVRAGDAAYARHEGVATPMDSHLLAYESSTSRDQMILTREAEPFWTSSVRFRVCRYQESHNDDPAKRAFLLCARQELVLAVRSRFLIIFAVVFAVLALLVASSGYVLTGGMGMQDFARTAASLVELVLLVIPLAALVIGATALTPDSGSAELLYSQPVARRTILFGKLAGLFLALVAAEAIGFGVSGLVLFSSSGEGGLGAFLGVLSASVVLTAIFLSVAAAITAGGTSRRRARSLATALVVWFATVVLFDVAVLGIASWLSSGTASRLLILSAMANPVDAVRTATLMAVEGTTAFGAASLAFLRFTHGAGSAAAWLVLSAIVWILGPLAVGAIRLTRSDI